MTNEEVINYINSIKHMFENGINRTTRNCTVYDGEALELHKKYIEACELAVQVMVTVEQQKMSNVRLIDDADALKKKIYDEFEAFEELTFTDFIRLLNDAPTLSNPCSNPCNFTRPAGNWKETGYETGALGITYRQTQCSNCGWEHTFPMW